MGTTSKALSLLDLFTRQRPQIGLSELARLSGANKATCYRLMTELAEHGLIEQVGSAREYRIGPAVLRLATVREATVPMREAAQAVLQRLASETGETAHLSNLIGGRLVSMAFAYPAGRAMLVSMEDTDTLAFHATSSGYAVLAFSDPDFAARALAGPLDRLTEATLTDREAVTVRVTQARATGLAETEGTFEAEVASLAAPLFGADGQCMGALAVAAPSVRMTAAQKSVTAAALLRGAYDLMALWGGSVPPALALLWSQRLIQAKG